MRILCSITEAATNLVPTCGADLFHGRGIGPKPVGDDALRSAVFLHDPLEELQRCGSAYGPTASLAWLVNRKKIAPHIPVFDESNRN